MAAGVACGGRRVLDLRNAVRGGACGGWVLASLRRGRAGVDLLAVLSLVGTLWVGEYVAGALIAVMLSTGRALDAAAQRRASHDLRALLERAPRSARRRIADADRSRAAGRGRDR